MAITVKHKFVSAIPDAGDPTIVQPSNWNDDHQLTGTIPVANGGTGASTLTGYVKGNGTSTMTASSTIPSTDVTGLGTMSTQNANAVAVTGGTINGTTIGATTASTGAFTYLSTSSTTNITPTLSFNGSNTNISSGAIVSGSYLQSILQNKSATAFASTNYVLSNDLGTDSSYYGEFGMNSSVYSSGTPADFFSLNNGVYFSCHDGDMTIGSGNGFKTYFAWGTTGQSAHVINATGAIGLNTSITGSTNFGTAGQVLTSGGSAATPTWTTPTTGTVTSVSGTAPVSVATGTTTPVVSLATGYGDTQNPYASKTANFVLAAPNGTAGVPTFRAIVAADIPTLNQSTTGSADTLTTGRTIAITGDLTYTSPSFNGSANVTAAGTLATVNANVGTFTKITVNAKGLATAASQASLTDISSPTASFSFGSQNLTNLLDPVNAQDGATKNYVDSVAQGLDAKASCVCATTANITLSGTQTIDGIAVVAGNRVLVKNQTLSQNNGIYVASATAWTRATDMDTWAEVPNSYVWVETGTTQADTGWVCTSDAGGTLGTTPITWVQFAGAGSYTAGTGLTLTGTQFSITNTGTAGTYGSATLIPVITTNAQGQVTGVTTASNPQGTVTSVAQSFTGGLISVAGSPITGSGTLALTVAGTSGGIPYFSSASTWATSAALAANSLVIGGGAGVAPSTITTGTGVTTALGVSTGTTGSFVVNGGALGTPSSGTVTNLTGTASININGTVGATTATTGAFTTVSASGVITSTLATGTAPFTVASTTQVANLNAATSGIATNVAGGTVGAVNYQSAASTTAFLTGNTTTTPQFVTSTGTGTVAQAPTLTSSTGSGSVVLATSPTLVTPLLGTPTSGNFSTGTFTWPTFNQNTTGTAAGLSATLVATSGGTGQSTYAVGDLLVGGATNTLTKLADVATGNSLISGGVGVAPSWGKIGLTTHVSGTLPVANGGTGLTTYAVGDIVYASATGTLASLADIATGNALISGGVGVAPSYGKIGLATHVSGNLPVTNLNSGTGASATTYWRGDGTWGTPTSGAAGSTTQVQYNNAGALAGSANFTYDGTTLKAQAVNATNGLVVNSNTVSASYTIPSGSSAMSAGPMTVASGQTVTVSSGSRWVIL